jgi:hypothetical protein
MSKSDELHPLLLQEIQESREFREQVRDELKYVNQWIAVQNAKQVQARSRQKITMWVLGLIVGIGTSLLGKK